MLGYVYTQPQTSSEIVQQTKLNINLEIKMKQINVKKHFFLLVIIYSPIALLFYLLPELDLNFSQLFYTPQEGFFFEKYKFSKLISYTSYGITGLVLLGCIFFGMKNFLQTKSLKFVNYRNIIFVFMVFLIAPVLIVQFGLKNHSHRPRPYNIIEFSGTQQFVDFSQIGRVGECIKNCSFTSGHAAVGYACICFAFLPFLRRYCTKLKIAGWTLGTLLGLSRVISGYHFLSDVLFSGFFMYLVILSIFSIMYRRDEP